MGMRASRRVYPEELSVKEIRHLLLERRRNTRHARLEQFHKTGRVQRILGEESQDASISPSVPRQDVQNRSLMDRVLLGVELLAVIAFVGVVVTGISTLSTFNKNIAVSFRPPTLEPTPLIQAVVLPDGHTPPTVPGGARPNEAEIPEHLRPLWQSFSKLPTPIPAMEQAVRVQIPSIRVDAPVVQGDSWDQLKKGVGQQIGSPNPGTKGNIVLSGHNDVYGEVFRYLDQLQPGDRVILFSNQRQYTYVVTGTEMVEPTAVEVMAPTPDARITLISCHPYLIDDHRIVVSAVLQSQ
jgi:sortase A